MFTFQYSITRLMIGQKVGQRIRLFVDQTSMNVCIPH
jgi:hypothetical protein